MYTKITGEIKLKLLRNGRWFELLESIKVSGIGFDFEVPAETRTDFASVPRFLWIFIPPIGLHSRAAVVHDYLYYRGRPSRASEVHDYLYRNGLYSRRKCDGIFYNIMLYDGVGKTKAKIMYWAVRLFGWRHYGRRT